MNINCRFKFFISSAINRSAWISLFVMPFNSGVSITCLSPVKREGGIILAILTYKLKIKKQDKKCKSR